MASKAAKAVKATIENPSTAAYAAQKRQRLTQILEREFDMSTYESTTALEVIWPHILRLAGHADKRLWGDTRQNQYSSTYFPIEGISVQWPEEYMSLVPYSRGTSNVIPVAGYVTRLHLELMLMYVNQYADTLKENQGSAMSEPQYETVRENARSLHRRITAALQYLSDVDLSEGMVQTLWDDAVDGFEKLHRGNYPEEFPQWFAAWKRGQSPQK